MTKTISALTISDDVSTDVAQAILTATEKWGKDPQVLLRIVREVHDTLRDMSLRSAPNQVPQSHSTEVQGENTSE